MDRECVSMLPLVCEVLAASGSSLPDDTSLEKLLDWFTALTEAGVSLPQACPCLLDFISTVVYNNTASDPSILSFTLKLTGLISATEGDFKVFQEGSVLDLVFDPHRWQEAGLWEDPCIRIGWVQGFRSMLQHSSALGFFAQAGFIETLLQLQTDTSLFVASAANQLLCHVLLLCQSVSSEECNSIDRKGNLKCQAVLMETDHNRSNVVLKIFEYLKKSLVPKETSELYQSQQVLKLLTLLLSQARPPLRDTLLLTVSESLEELVTANYSQLTLPLMDVLLAAHSSRGSDEPVPGRGVDHLLSFMLKTRKPVDLIHAAAAFLRGGHNDCVHKAQCVSVLLLPLDVITGHGLLGEKNSADEHRFSMKEQLRSKTSCISMICVSLTNLPQITSMAPDCLPCPPALVVSAVLSLLRLCSGDSSSSSAGCHEAFRNVTGSGKVQKCALEALSALSSSSGVKVVVVEVFTLLIHYLNDPASDPTVLQKSYQAFIKWIGVCTDLFSVTEQLRKDLIQVVRKRVCDMRWEVRDSTVEFLGHLSGVQMSGEACDAPEFLLGGCCFTIPLLKEALQDAESYVRASSISALAQTLVHSWQQGAAPTQEQVEIVSRLLEILSQDTEGFSRRAVVQYFITWFSSCSSPTSCSLLMRSVPSVLSRGRADLDWEVKVHTLELAELLLDQAFSGCHGYTKRLETHSHPSHPYAVMSDKPHEPHSHTETHSRGVESDLVGAMNSLVDRGVFSVLLSGVVDCDRPVGLKACQLLIRLRDTVCPLLLGDQDAAADGRVSFELSECGWAQEIRKILGIKKVADIPAQRIFHRSDSEDGDMEEEDVCAGEHATRVGVCEALRSLDLDKRLAVLTQSSDHIHNSPLSLLQDIITASTRNTRLNSQPGQEVIVDCY